MNSRDDITLGVASPPSLSPPVESPGVLLTAARQKLGLSVGDIAAKLRMSVTQIDAIERGDYGKLPKGTFLRGFVRSYAKLVGLDAEQVLRSLEETHAESRQPTIVVPTQNITMTTPGERYSNPRMRLLLALMLMMAVIAGGAYWWFQVRPAQPERIGKLPVKAVEQPVAAPLPATAASLTPAAPVDVSSQTADAAAAPSAVATPAPANAATAATAPSPAPESPAPPLQQVAPLTQTTAPLASAPTAASTDSAKAPVPKGSGSLRFTFSGESWVEVVDASGRTLVSRRFQSGESESVVGKLPVSVVIGNATVTKLQFNQVDFDLTPHTRVAVARFTLK